MNAVKPSIPCFLYVVFCPVHWRGYCVPNGITDCYDVWLCLWSQNWTNAISTRIYEFEYEYSRYNILGLSTLCTLNKYAHHRYYCYYYNVSYSELRIFSPQLYFSLGTPPLNVGSTAGGPNTKSDAYNRSPTSPSRYTPLYA